MEERVQARKDEDAEKVMPTNKDRIAHPPRAVEDIIGQSFYPRSRLQAIDQLLREGIMEAENVLRTEVAGLQIIDYAQDRLVVAAYEEVRVRVAMDSGAVANVINPESLPGDAVPVPNPTDEHFINAQGGHIQRYGKCLTKMTGKRGAVTCDWDVCDVARALHSVSTVCGQVEAPKQDVLFNAGHCYVVPPGVVDRIMREVNAVAEYERSGNLYIAEMTLSSFTRQGNSS